MSALTLLHHRVQEYVAEAKAQQAEAAQKLALVDEKIAQVKALGAQG